MPTDSAHLRRWLVEAVVIVGSILLAFAIDAWWDGRQGRAREAELLRALQADLTSDSLFLAAQRESLPGQVRAAHALLRLDPTDLPSTDSLTRLDLTFSRLTPDGWSESAYRAMLESGELASIRDPALARALTGYYEGVLREARDRASLDRQAMDRQVETAWLDGNVFELADVSPDELLSAGNTDWVHRIDRAGYRDWLTDHRNVVLFRMDQRLLLLRHFRKVEEHRAALSRRITDHLAGG